MKMQDDFISKSGFLSCQTWVSPFKDFSIRLLQNTPSRNQKNLHEERRGADSSSNDQFLIAGCETFSLTFCKFASPTFEIGRYVHLAGNFNGALQVLLLLVCMAYDIASSLLGLSLEAWPCNPTMRSRLINSCASLPDKLLRTGLDPNGVQV